MCPHTIAGIAANRMICGILIPPKAIMPSVSEMIARRCAVVLAALSATITSKVHDYTLTAQPLSSTLSVGHDELSASAPHLIGSQERISAE
jgi:hypothetical protein